MLNFISTECSSSLEEFTIGWKRFGFTCNCQDMNEEDREESRNYHPITTYREWAPNAKEAYLIGEFSK